MLSYGEPLEYIGNGGYCKVAKTDKNYAMKLYELNDNKIEHCFKEFIITRMVDSPYCMPVLSLGIYDDELYSITPLGKPLYHRSTKIRLPFSTQGYIDIVRAVKDLHDKNIWHLDIKMENCIQLPDRVVLSDFGTAVYNGYSNIDLSSPHIRPPERLLGQPYSKEFDIWSLGYLLYEWITGEYPFKYDSEVDTLFSQLQILGTPSEETWPGISKLPNWKAFFPKWTGNNQIFDDIKYPGLRDLLRKILVMNPAKRISLTDILHHPALQIPQRNLKTLINPTFNFTTVKYGYINVNSKLLKYCNYRFRKNDTATIINLYQQLMFSIDHKYQYEIFYLVCIFLSKDVGFQLFIDILTNKFNDKQFITNCINILPSVVENMDI